MTGTASALLCFCILSATTAKTTTHTAGDVQEQYAHTAQTMAKHLAAQARNVKYTHRIFESTIALLKSHLEDTRSLMGQWGKQGDPKVSDPYMNPFSAPFTAYQQMLEAVGNCLKTNVRGSGESFEAELRELGRGKSYKHRNC
jgi:hypothetical protein